MIGLIVSWSRLVVISVVYIVCFYLISLHIFAFSLRLYILYLMQG